MRSIPREEENRQSNGNSVVDPTKSGATKDAGTRRSRVLARLSADCDRWLEENTPSFAILRARTIGQPAEPCEKKKGDTLDVALAYSNLLQVRSSARRTGRLATRSTTERYNRIRDHLRRVFHSRDNLDGINSLKLCSFNTFNTFFDYYNIDRIS